MKKGATLGVAALSYFSCRGGRVEGAKNKNGSGFTVVVAVEVERASAKKALRSSLLD